MSHICLRHRLLLSLRETQARLALVLSCPLNCKTGTDSESLLDDEIIIHIFNYYLICKL